MSVPRRLAALLVLAAAPLVAPAAAKADPPAPSAHVPPPCAWLNPMTKGYAFCVAQHDERRHELTAQSDEPEATDHAAGALPSHGGKDPGVPPTHVVHDNDG